MKRQRPLRLREEQSRRSERVSGENLVRGYAGHSSSIMYPEEPALGMPVTYVSEASVEHADGGPRANR